MSTDLIIELVQQALILSVVIALPVLGAALLVGLFSGLLQAVTGVQDATLGLVPRLLVTTIVLAIAAPWMLDELTSFSSLLLEALVEVQR